MSGIDILIFLTPVFGLVFNIFFQVASLRIVFKTHLLKSLVSGFVFGFFCVCLFNLLFNAGVDYLLTDIVTYAILSYCYFHFINLGETGRRIRLLFELERSRTGLTKAEIFMRYGGKEILDNRLARLIKNGQVVIIDGKYFIAKPLMLLVSRTLSYLKIILFGKGAWN